MRLGWAYEAALTTRQFNLHSLLGHCTDVAAAGCGERNRMQLGDGQSYGGRLALSIQLTPTKVCVWVLGCDCDTMYSERERSSSGRVLQ
jgi:hypothetical protein